jgi:hypothetical protein
MNEEQKQELIKKLSAGRESISILKNMLKREQWNVEQELKLASEAKQCLDETLFELTGDVFYQNKYEGEKNG